MFLLSHSKPVLEAQKSSNALLPPNAKRMRRASKSMPDLAAIDDTNTHSISFKMAVNEDLSERLSDQAIRATHSRREQHVFYCSIFILI